jgi:hypothetical protein
VPLCFWRHVMGSLAEYFERISYKPTWFIGDRVFGKWNKIPFIGTVGNDTDKIGDEGPRVTVHVDLPIMLQGKAHTVIIVKPKELKRLMSMDDKEPLKLLEAGSIPAKRTKQTKAKK